MTDDRDRSGELYEYMSWVGFRPDGRPGRWSKVHIKANDRTFLCGIKIPTDIFDMSRSPTANLLCAKCENIKELENAKIPDH